MTSNGHYPSIDKYVQTKKMDKRAKVQKKSDAAKAKFVKTMMSFTNPGNNDVQVPINWDLVHRMDAQTRMMLQEKSC